VSAWPEPVERVAEFLQKAAVESRVEEFPAGTLTAEDAANAVGCDLAQIVKSLVFVCDGRAVVALVPGDRRGDAGKIARGVEADAARVAKPDEVAEATGFAPGAVPPFPLPENTVVLMDSAFFSHPLVWAGAGSAQHVLGMPPAELARVARARPLDVSAD
jgi:prolyl-tRNA editing enzyme YbaK/EbsC (Cys-tRNA(Pro) deacylase)